MSKKTEEGTWVICPECKNKLKQDHLLTHMKLVHNKKIEDVDESSVKVLSKTELKQKKVRHVSRGSIAIIIVIFAIVIGVAFFVFSGLLTNTSTNGNGNNKPNTGTWLDNYTPVYSIGTGSNDFWIDFPVGNPSVGQSVQHKIWITDDLEEKSVIFVCHRTGCGPCTPQADRVKALIEAYGDDIVFYDLDSPFEGFGTIKEGILEKYNQAFYYDPNGGDHYIALTGIFTLINDGGEVKTGWHSWEGNVDDTAMENWIKDAIYYYHVNGDD